jgi:multidrug efflux system outer membrane protein
MPLAACLLLAACTTVGPDFQPARAPWLDAWTGGSLATLPAPRVAPVPEWWRHFNDPVLDALVAQAQRANPNVRTAGLRIMEARAQLGVAGSLLEPQLRQATGELLWAGEKKAGGRDFTGATLSAGFQLGWEIDFWGKFRRGVESADAAYFASIAQYDDMQVLLAAQAASLYCTIRTLEARLAIARDSAAIQKRSLEITERLFKGGSDSELDVQQALAQYLATMATIPQYQGAIRQSQNALAVLLARPPGPLPEMQGGTGVIPQGAVEAVVDIPAQRLRRRPDIRAAEMLMAAQSAQIGVAAADLYPTLSLAGLVGLSASSINGSSRTVSWGLGPSLVWNVFDGGRITNTVLLQDARFQQLHEQYQEALLRAAREVDDAAGGYVRTGEQIDFLAGAVKAAQRSLDIANLQFREGLVDFSRVLDAQRVLFLQQDALVQSRGGLAQNLVALYKAMGGGWEPGRARPVLDDATLDTMNRRSAWNGLLEAPLPPAGEDPRPAIPPRQP